MIPLLVELLLRREEVEARVQIDLVRAAAATRAAERRRHVDARGDARRLDDEAAVRDARDDAHAASPAARCSAG